MVERCALSDSDLKIKFRTILLISIAARERPRAGSKQMATYQAVVAQTQSSGSSSNLCCSVATQTWSTHHVACSLLQTIHYMHHQ